MIIEIGDDPQTFQGQMRMNDTDLRQPPREQVRVATCRDNVNFFAA